MYQIFFLQINNENSMLGIYLSVCQPCNVQWAPIKPLTHIFVVVIVVVAEHTIGHTAQGLSM